jgi:flagellar biogenesis protein FliO
MLTSRHVLAPKTLKRWMPVAIIGLVAVTAGIALPSALPAVADPLKANATTESANTPKLAYTPPQLPDAPDPKSMLLRLAAATAIVLTLCIGTILLGKRWLGGTHSRPNSNNQLRLLETLALGNRCSIYLIHVANRPVLIAADPSGLKSIVPLPELFEQTFTTASGADPLVNDAPVSISQLAENPLATNSETHHGRYN